MLIFAIEMKKEHQKLLEAIEKEVGKKLLTPKDFEWLSEKVETRTKEHLTKTRDALHTILITTYGLKENLYSGSIYATVTTDDLFQQ